jgi:hypothetical protein
VKTLVKETEVVKTLVKETEVVKTLVKETEVGEMMMMGAKLTSHYLFSLDYCLFCPYKFFEFSVRYLS